MRVDNRSWHRVGILLSADITFKSVYPMRQSIRLYTTTTNIYAEAVGLSSLNDYAAIVGIESIDHHMNGNHHQAIDQHPSTVQSDCEASFMKIQMALNWSSSTKSLSYAGLDSILWCRLATSML